MCLLSFSYSWMLLHLIQLSLSLSLLLSLLPLYLRLSLRLFVLIASIIKPPQHWADSSFINSAHIDLISLMDFKIKSIARFYCSLFVIHCDTYTVRLHCCCCLHLRLYLCLPILMTCSVTIDLYYTSMLLS